MSIPLPGRPRCLAALALMTGLLLTAHTGTARAEPDAQATSAPAPADSFFTPPSPLPAGKPGDVIRSRPVAFHPLPLVPSSAKAWQVLYLSTSATGERISVSGTILVPLARYAGPRPIVAYAIGTHGMGDQCAPSRGLTIGTDYEGFAVAAALQRGWAVAVTDYEGLGTPGDHTYLVGHSAAHAVLDSVRAAQRLAPAKLPAAGPVGIQGYSQGGASAAWAAQLKDDYAPELDVRGVAAGGVPADMAGIAAGADGGPFTGMLLMASAGFDTAYSELDLNRYLNAQGRAMVNSIRYECLLPPGPAFLAAAFHRLSEYTTANPLNDPLWRARLMENSLGGTSPDVPVLLTHAGADEVVPLGQAKALYDTYCAAGANVSWRTLNPAEHAIGLIIGVPPVQDWLERVLEGRPAASDCRSAAGAGNSPVVMSSSAPRWNIASR